MRCAISAMTWTVLPRPISSARMPFRRLLYSPSIHCSPTRWYSRREPLPGGLSRFSGLPAAASASMLCASDWYDAAASDGAVALSSSIRASKAFFAAAATATSESPLSRAALAASAADSLLSASRFTLDTFSTSCFMYSSVRFRKASSSLKRAAASSSRLRDDLLFAASSLLYSSMSFAFSAAMRAACLSASSRRLYSFCLRVISFCSAFVLTARSSARVLHDCMNALRRFVNSSRIARAHAGSTRVLCTRDSPPSAIAALRAFPILRCSVIDLYNALAPFLYSLSGIALSWTCSTTASARSRRCIAARRRARSSHVSLYGTMGSPARLGPCGCGALGCWCMRICCATRRSAVAECAAASPFFSQSSHANTASI
mmetsp:Transcript_5865/g.15115  ORF Transcript_5865/g.15115 Transcript_5865/m.15115 type:complete len:374 (-) Transcript_5865:392-1513(-)